MSHFPKNFPGFSIPGKISRFPELICFSPETAFVRVVTPRTFKKIDLHSSCLTKLTGPWRTGWGCVFLGKSKSGSWIHKIHPQGGFFGSNPNPDFWDSQCELFLGKVFKKVFLTSGFTKKKKKRMVRNRCGTCMTSNWTHVVGPH